MSDIYLSGGSKKIILNGTTYFASGGGGYTPTLITKTITENGTYSAEDDNADGYSEVTVEVPTGCPTITMTDYNNLTPEQKANGDYYISDYSASITRDFPYTASSIVAVAKKEGSMSISQNTSNKSLSTIWNGGGNIGLDVRYKVPIDFTDITELKYNLSLGACYGNGSQAKKSAWYYVVAIVSESSVEQTSYFSGDSTNFEKSKKYSLSNQSYSAESINVSSLTGEHYLVVVAHGWNSTISNIQLKCNYSGTAVSRHGTIYAPLV